MFCKKIWTGLVYRIVSGRIYIIVKKKKAMKYKQLLIDLYTKEASQKNVITKQDNKNK